MKILVFMQNMWVNDPEGVKAMLNRQRECGEHTQEQMRKKVRRRLIHYALFAGCMSGRRLKKAFGDLTGEMIWEEASREIGGASASSFPADLDHMRTAIKEEKPDVVLAFGKTATEAMELIAYIQIPAYQFIRCCHPAARHATVQDDLNRAAETLRKIIENKIDSPDQVM